MTLGCAPDDYPEDADEARELGLIVEDDPLYDGEMDDRDEKWVQKRFSTQPRHYTSSHLTAHVSNIAHSHAIDSRRPCVSAQRYRRETRTPS